MARRATAIFNACVALERIEHRDWYDPEAFFAG
jgi:hypothetical protein